jgi:hypothetical protein
MAPSLNAYVAIEGLPAIEVRAIVALPSIEGLPASPISRRRKKKKTLLKVIIHFCLRVAAESGLFPYGGIGLLSVSRLSTYLSDHQISNDHHPWFNVL